MKSQIGDMGTEQFLVTTKVDGKVVRIQAIHDPFLCNKTVTVLGRWDAFCGIFRRRKIVTELRVDGTEGVIRAIMGLDPDSLRLETEAIIRARAISREATDPAIQDRSQHVDMEYGGGMNQYRKKPVVVEAVQVPLERSDSNAWKELMKFLPSSAYSHGGNFCGYVDIATLEGTMRANPGDFVIRGVKGEFYPCKPDIFAATYEKVNP